MQEAKRHRIRKAVFDLRFPDEETAFRLRKRLEEMFPSTIVPALEEVFDTLAPDGRVYRLERLEIDLGVINPDRLDADLIRQAILAQLAGCLAGLSPAKPEIAPPAVSLEETLIHFLEYGDWPWHSLYSGVAEAEQAWRALDPVAARRLAQRLQPRLRYRHFRQRLIYQFSVDLVPWLIRQLQPAAGDEVLRIGRTVLGELETPASKDLLLRVVAEMPPDEILPAGALTRRFRAQAAQAPASRQEDPDLGSALSAQDAEYLHEKPSRREVEAGLAITRRDRGIELPPAEASAPEQAVSRELAFYVRHAGIILLHPFFEGFFQRLRLLDEHQQFVSPASRAEAVHLLHYLAAGKESPPEPETLLFKVLCGFSLRAPLVRELPLSARAKEEAERLLAAAIQHWKKLKDTSPAGLREVFLQREGKLSGAEDGWQLAVERRAIDVLLDYLPWSLSSVRLPWLKSPLCVHWA